MDVSYAERDPEALNDRVSELVQELVRLDDGKGVVSPGPLEARARLWSNEMLRLRDPNEGTGGQHLLLSHIMSPGHLRTLVRIDNPPLSGALLLLPLVVSWFLLGVAEYLYQDAARRSEEVAALGFFSWWSMQPLYGPHVFSWLIAFIVAVIAGALYRHQARSRIVRKALRAIAICEDEVAGIVNEAIVAASLHDRSGTDIAAAAAELRTAAGRITTAAQALGVSELDRYEEITSAASATIAGLHQATADLNSGIGVLTETVQAASTVIEEWESSSKPVINVVDGLGTITLDTQKSVLSLSDSVQDSMKILQDADRTTSTVLDLANRIEEVEASLLTSVPELGSAISSLTALDSGFAEVARQLREALSTSTRLLALIDNLSDRHYASGPADE